MGESATLVPSPPSHALPGTPAVIAARKSSPRWRSVVVSFSWLKPDGTSDRYPRTFRLDTAQEDTVLCIIACEHWTMYCDIC
jgi:hypothetical protein